VETGGERDGALLGANLAVTESLVGVRRHENVGVFDDAAKVLCEKKKHDVRPIAHTEYKYEL
jgi:hypothetical protein